MGQATPSDFVQRLPDVPPEALLGFTPVLLGGAVVSAAPTGHGIFDYGLTPWP